MANAKPYEKATLFDAGGDPSKPWYVEYYFYSKITNKFERFRPTFDINRQTTIEEKRRWGKAAVDFMNEVLEKGYDPFEESELQQELELKMPAPQKKLLQIVYAVKEEMAKHATKPARESYRTMYNRFEKFIKTKEFENLTIHDVTAAMVNDFQAFLKDEMGLAYKTVNVTISHVGQFWDEKEISTRVTDNPFRNIKPVTAKDYRGKAMPTKKQDTDFVPCTSEEMDKIISYYKSIGATEFLRVLGMVYYAWVRPVEISRLRIQDIDLNHRSIRFLKENTKDDEFAHVQIVDELYELLKTMDLKKYPSSYFLFSRDLKPGDQMAKPWEHYTDKWWNTHVVKILGIKKKMYGIKHTGNIEFILKNKGKVDLKWQQMQNRHASASQTETYIKKLGIYFVDIKGLTFRSFT